MLKATRETTGPPAKLTVSADRRQISADGEDVSLITVGLADAEGRSVPDGSALVTFKLEGPGRLIGVGNGDPSCHEDDRPTSANEAKRSLFSGLCQAIVQSLKQPGEIRLLSSSGKFDPAWTIIKSEETKPRPAL
jgi:beta-galactosidase